MKLRDWVPVVTGVVAVIVAIVVAAIVANRGWPAATYRGDMLEAGVKVATTLFVIAAFLERGSAVINEMLFGAESTDLENRARMALVTATADLPATEFAQKLLDERKRRMRLAISFLAAVLVAAAGARALGGLFDRPAGEGQRDLFDVMDVLLTAAVLAGGSSGIGAIIDLFRARARAAKAQGENEVKAAWLGVAPSALQTRYLRAGVTAAEIASARTRPALIAPVADPAADPAADRATATDDAHDAAANREWQLADPAAAAAATAGGSAEALAATAAAKDWRVAEALATLRRQLDAAFPGRSKASDGTIGDARHCAANPASSDHCANIPDGAKWVVTAFDATHDPAHGCDMDAVTAKVIASRDPRVKYIIWNRRICSSYPANGQPAWTWRHYGGASPHDHHAHVSVLADKPHYDDARDWTIA